MQTQSNDTSITPTPGVTDSTLVDLTRYKTWRGKQPPSAWVYRVLTCAIQEREVHTTTFALNAINHLIWYPEAHVKGRAMILVNQRTVSCVKMVRIYGIALFVWIVVGIWPLLRQHRQPRPVWGRQILLQSTLHLVLSKSK